MAVTDQQVAELTKRFHASRVARGLPPMIEDEGTPRLIAASKDEPNPAS